MTDDELTALLDRHGEQFRGSHLDRPVPNWEVATTSRRRWLTWAVPVAVAAVVIAAVVLPVVLLRGSGRSAAPAGSPTAPAPTRMFGVAGGREVLVRSDGTTYSWQAPHQRFVAAAQSSDDLVSYAAAPTSGCATDLGQVRSTRLSERSTSLAVVAGRVMAGTPGAMAVSPDGRQLAMVVQAPRLGHRGCSAATGVDIVALQGASRGQFTTYLSPARERLSSLAWVDDDHLAYRNDSAAQMWSVWRPGDPSSSGATGQVVGRDLAGVALVLRLGDRAVAVAGGSLRAVSPAGLGAHLGGVPSFALLPGITDIDSDSSGQHVLLVTTTGAFRWDAGRLRRLASPGDAGAGYGPWTEVGW